ncbi:MAG: hypothetical protein V2A73_06285 [Pseudomonadota bacterium]
MRDSYDDAMELARALLGGSESIDDIAEANDFANRALRLRPGDCEAWLLKAQTLSALQDDGSALACAEMALRRAPQSAEGHYWRTAILGDMERFADALKSADRALQCITEKDEWLLEDLYHEKGTILSALGRREEALAVLEEGLKRCPESRLLRAGLEPLQRDRIRKTLRVLPGGRL